MQLEVDIAPRARPGPDVGDVADVDPVHIDGAGPEDARRTRSAAVTSGSEMVVFVNRRRHRLTRAFWRMMRATRLAADVNARSTKLPMHPRPAVGAPAGVVDGLDALPELVVGQRSGRRQVAVPVVEGGPGDLEQLAAAKSAGSLLAGTPHSFSL